MLRPTPDQPENDSVNNGSPSTVFLLLPAPVSQQEATFPQFPCFFKVSFIIYKWTLHKVRIFWLMWNISCVCIRQHIYPFHCHESFHCLAFKINAMYFIVLVSWYILEHCFLGLCIWQWNFLVAAYVNVHFHKIRPIFKVTLPIYTPVSKIYTFMFNFLSWWLTLRDAF